MIERKYSANPFGKMQQVDVMSAAKVLLLKIYSITGWELPEASLQKILIDQLSKHLIESYATVNVNEVEYAFRRFGSSVKDWGKQMNLSLFDEVMAQYMQQRMEVSKVEETAPLPEDKQLTAQVMTDAEKIEFGRWSALNMQQIETVYNCYEVLRRLELMPQPTAEQAAAYLKIAKARYCELMSTDFFKGMDIQIWLNGYRQKLAVVDYFKNKKV